MFVPLCPFAPGKEANIVTSMFKSNQIETPPFDPASEPVRHALGVVSNEPTVRGAALAGEQATIGKGLVLHGEITGSESLFVDGKFEGSISLPCNRVTVGRNGQVNANINAREIVVLGKVRGNVSASDRVDIRAEGSVTGDVAAARISIEDGAFFKGGIDIRKSEQKSARSFAVTPAAEEALKEA